VRGVAAAAVALAAGACSVLLDPDECEGDGDCPAGRTCRAGLCRGGADAGADAARPPVPGDGDGDGVAATDDCDDEDAEVHPGALDLCGDGADWDCAGGPDLPCAVSDLSVPLYEARALARSRLGLVVGLSATGPGEAQVRRYDEGLGVALSGPVPGSRSIDAVLADPREDEELLWLADAGANRVWRAVNAEGALPTPTAYRIDRGRPLAPTSLALWHAEEPVDDMLFVGGLHGEVGHVHAVTTSVSASLPGVPNPARVATTPDGSRVLVASQPDATLRGVAPDDFGDPEVRESLVLSGAPRVLAVLPRRAVLLLSGAVVEVDLDSWAPAGDPVPVPATADLLAVDPDRLRVWVADPAGLLHVIDRARGAVVRRVDLRHARDREEALTARPVALLAEPGRCLVLLAGPGAAEGAEESLLMAVEP